MVCLYTNFKSLCTTVNFEITIVNLYPCKKISGIPGGIDGIPGGIGGIPGGELGIPGRTPAIPGGMHQSQARYT